MPIKHRQPQTLIALRWFAALVLAAAVVWLAFEAISGRLG